MKNNKFIFRTKWVKTDGHEHKIDIGIIVDVEHDLIFSGNKILFHVKSFCTNSEPDFRAYLLQDDTDVLEKVMYLSALFLQTPVATYSHVTSYRITLLHTFTVCIVYIVNTIILICKTMDNIYYKLFKILYIYRMSFYTN